MQDLLQKTKRGKSNEALSVKKKKADDMKAQRTEVQEKRSTSKKKRRNEQTQTEKEKTSYPIVPHPNGRAYTQNTANPPLPQ